MPARPPAPRLLATLRAAAARPGAPGPGAHLLVAASGGPDSTAALAALAELAPAQGWRLTAAHVAHRLRGAASADDAARVRALAARLGVAHVERAAPVAPGAGLEGRARTARHRALVALARDAGADRIVLAHTADDQAETLLLRLVRGAGRGGLAGMRATRGRLWRPLLDATRADVRRYLAERGLVAAVDLSNADLRHARSRMRRLVVPLLAAEFNPGLVPALAALAGRLRDEDALLDAQAAARLAALADADGLDVAVADVPAALGRRVVRAWLERGARRGVAAAHVERVLALAHGGGGAVAVPGPARIVRSGARLVRRAGREAPRADARADAAAVVPGASVAHPAAGWRLRLGPPRPRRAGETRAAGVARALLDADALPATLLVRGPRRGDRITLPGVGTRKLQDVLVDAKVAREDRARVPVLLAGEAVVWVAGVARGAPARLGPGTTRVVDAVVEPYAAPVREPHG